MFLQERCTKNDRQTDKEADADGEKDKQKETQRIRKMKQRKSD